MNIDEKLKMEILKNLILINAEQENVKVEVNISKKEKI